MLLLFLITRLLMCVWKAAPCLASGCTMILKPSELTPFSSLELADICHAAGVPPGVFNVLPGYGQECGEPLATHPLVQKIAFTGSVGVGSKLMSLAAKDIKNVTLELGGKS